MIPKVRDSSQDFDVGLFTTIWGNPYRGYTEKFHSVDYEALLASWPHYRLDSGKWSGGGPLFVHKRKVLGNTASIDVSLNGIGIHGTVQRGLAYGPYRQPITARLSGDNLSSAQPSGYQPPSFTSFTTQLIADNTRGYELARPGNPVASMGQFLYEMYSDLPQIPLKALRKLKRFNAIGDEYLNVQFGWIPFVNDLKKMYNLYRGIDKALAKLIKENGKTIHRRKTLLNTSEKDSGTNTWDYPFYSLGVPNWFHGSTTLTWSTETVDKRWWSGSFRYYTPEIGSSQWTRRATAALFGVYPTPALLYEVLPWSWLLDWFTNVGTVISNASTNAVDNLTCDYSYGMRHTLTKRTEDYSTNWRPAFTTDEWSYGQGSLSIHSEDSEENKLRYGGGYPFMPSLRFDEITPYRIGIAAALGISRTRLLSNT